MQNKQSILIIEDGIVNRKIIIKILDPVYHILEAENGVEGLEILHKNRDISAVLLDLMMPVMNGYEFLEKLQEEHQTGIPIIVMTGIVDEETERRVLDLGAWDFVPKPYNAQVLTSRLRNAIARSQVDVYRELNHFSEHDPLTGLHNRGKMFKNTMNMLQEYPDRHFSFVRFDIDNFSLYNTSFGEKEGDTLLIYFANIIREIARTYPMCTFGRMNADVFCMCFQCEESEKGKELLLKENIVFAQNKLLEYRQDYLLEMSVGLCNVEASLKVEDLYYRASLGAKKCKNKYGVNLGVYDAEEIAKAQNAVEVTNEMEKALAEGHFVVYLQPKFELKNDKACGAEALVRWMHPEKGLIPPGKFIPVFEKNGFIGKVDYYVWEQTCMILHKWMQEGIEPLPISVNISRISLYNPQIVEMLVDLVEKYELSPSLLELEITESAYMTNPDFMKDIVKRLHAASFLILMDDFGSDYSSLNTLKNIEMDILKVDMKFMPTKDDIEKGEIIVASVIKMAKWLGMDVIVEGVETRRQRDFLEGTGCNCVQGYYYSRPISLEEYEKNYVYVEVQQEYQINERRLSATGEEITILIIDDSEMSGDILTTYFENQYRVQVCACAEDGLVYLKRHPNIVKLILVDNMMDGMTGLDFLLYCQYSNELSGIPKVMITASNSVEDQVKAFEAGAYDYITKPFTREIVMARVKHIMETSYHTTSYDKVEKEFYQSAERDPNTGLLSHRSFRELCSKLLTYFKDDEMALLLIDVDDFALINERKGAEVGDAILIDIADELKDAVYKSDVVGRLGGDEYLVLLCGMQNRRMIKRKASELIRQISYLLLNKYHVDSSVSIGVSFTSPEDTIDTVFARADQALSEAKDSGKGRTMIYGEVIASIQNDDRPIVMVCGQDVSLYQDMALAYGDEAYFAFTQNMEQFEQTFQSYSQRIKAVCLDVNHRMVPELEQFYQELVEKGCGHSIPLLAMCKEGSIEQLRTALGMDIQDLISIPLQTDIIQKRLSYAIRLGCEKKEE